MTIHSMTLTNPGAESGSTTGWTSFGDPLAVGTTYNGIFPHAGSWLFGTADGFSEDTGQYQNIDVTAYAAAIDAGTAAARISGWTNNDGADFSRLWLSFYNGGGTLLEEQYTNLEQSSPANSWSKHEIYRSMPANTRTVRIGTRNVTNGFASRVRWDEFEMDISDSSEADWPAQMATHASQLGIYVLATFPSDEAIASQLGTPVLAASETSSGLYRTLAHQLGCYVLCRPNGDRRELRAWRFKQDDNEFYGIQLGTDGTLVYNMLSQQWCQWRSPGEIFWRVEDVVDWEGFNLGCDSNTGKVWEIDPEGRLDYDDTPIVSIVVGYLTHRMRQFVQCHMAELAVSEGQPPSGFADGSVGISLRTSTDDGQTYVNHGEVPGEGIGEDMTARWYGLGLMRQPGMLFELTDTGYARRIDGLDIEMGDE